ncbi:unnamed protein product [Orchesella dallaii]|uniref:Poly [ADP-ribose] polymerase n=1 Tax=Orchesella dallaii TaxID=48710 RepID=A0ABP1QB20_9HEXA
MSGKSSKAKKALPSSASLAVQDSASATPIQKAAFDPLQAQGTSVQQLPSFYHFTLPLTMSSSSTSSRPPHSGLGSLSASASISVSTPPTTRQLPTPATTQRRKSNRLLTRGATRQKVKSVPVPGLHVVSPQTGLQSAATTSSGGSIPTTVHPRPPPPPVASTSTGLKRKIEEEEIEAAAVDVLIGLPGITKQSLESMLKVANLLTASDPMHKLILSYVNNGHRHSFGMEVMNIVQFIREDDNLDFDKDPKFDNQFRMMLWHGTTPAAAAAILQEGFQTPIPKRQMFGTGIYFADQASKSANYCCIPHTIYHNEGDIGYLFLCDVLLGKTYNAKQPHHEYTAPPTATSRNGETLYFDSVKCTGEYIPDASENVYCGGSLMPIGKAVRNTLYPTYSVVHNEYVVYSAEKVKPKFLVKIKFRSSRFTN